MKKAAFIIVILSFLLSSCPGGGGDLSSGSRKFWTQNAVTEAFYQIEAELLASNSRCEIWAEKNSGVTVAMANATAAAYNIVYSRMMNWFGYYVKHPGGTSDIMEYANLVAKGNRADGKLTILLLDIKDTYQQGVRDSYVAGYFWSGDLFQNNPLDALLKYSNELDMIYMDIYPGILGTDEFNATLAHEMQHLINFVSSAWVDTKRTKVMDTWIDEGLSGAAEWVYLQKHPASRILWYNADKSGLIKKGNNFFVWGNRTGAGPEQDAVLDDYATTYLFFQWLRLQTNNDIYRNILLSQFYDHNAITSEYGGSPSWSTLLSNWLAANYLGNSGTSPWGYRSDSALNKLTKHYAPGNGGSQTTIPLFPGEGVYSYVSGSALTMPTGPANISYGGLGGGTLSPTGSIPVGDALLTYNTSTAKTYNTDGTESGTGASGTITGAVPSISPFLGSANTSIAQRAPFGPFPISISDARKQRGASRNFGFELVRPAERANIHE